MGVHLFLRFRPYEEDGTYTTFGPADYNPVEGTVHLNRLRFRTWEDPGFSSIGGSGILDPQPPAPPSERGSFAMLISGGSDKYVIKTFGSTTTIYMKAQIYITSAQYTAMLPQTTSGDILAIIGTDNFDWQGLFITKRNQSNVIDGNLYFHDYWSPNSQRKLITPNTWYNIEIGIKPSGANYQAAFAVNGTISSWNTFSGPSGYDEINIGTIFNTSTDGWYLDNGAYSTTDWVLLVGAPDFQDGFETGNFSAWSSTVGSPTLVTPP